MQTLLQDLRYGARILMKQPGFMLIAVLTPACWLPARQVTKVDLLIALRGD